MPAMSFFLSAGPFTAANLVLVLSVINSNNGDYDVIFDQNKNQIDLNHNQIDEKNYLKPGEERKESLANHDDELTSRGNEEDNNQERLR